MDESKQSYKSTEQSMKKIHSELTQNWEESGFCCCLPLENLLEYQSFPLMPGL